jgi:hypothetical protein
MLKKSRALALAVTTAGLIGFSAPMASAATTASQPGNSGGVVTGQVPSHNCGNVASGNVVPGNVPGNVVPGNVTGAKALPDGGAVVKSLLSYAVGNSTAASGAGCGLTSKQIQALVCSGALPAGAGGSQVPPDAFASALAMLLQSVVSTSAPNCSVSGK